MATHECKGVYFYIFQPRCTVYLHLSKMVANRGKQKSLPGGKDYIYQCKHKNVGWLHYTRFSNATIIIERNF